MNELRMTLVFTSDAPIAARERLLRSFAAAELRAFRQLDSSVYVECVTADCAPLFMAVLAVHEAEEAFGPGTHVSWMHPKDGSPDGHIGGIPSVESGFIVR